MPGSQLGSEIMPWEGEQSKRGRSKLGLSESGKKQVGSDATSALVGPNLRGGSVETPDNTGLMTAMTGGEGPRWNLWEFWTGSGWPVSSRSNARELCFKTHSPLGALGGSERVCITSSSPSPNPPSTALCRRDSGGDGSNFHAPPAAPGAGAGLAGAEAPAARLHAHRGADHHLLLLAYGHHRHLQGSAGVLGERLTRFFLFPGSAGRSGEHLRGRLRRAAL